MYRVRLRDYCPIGGVVPFIVVKEVHERVRENGIGSPGRTTPPFVLRSTIYTKAQ